TLVLVALILLGGTAMAQQINANRLCLHNGAEYFIGLTDKTGDNTGCGKYYPAPQHWAGKGQNPGPNNHWPWKLQGWAWSANQGYIYGPTWYWVTTLGYSVDNPYATTMTWPYPFMHFAGLTHNGFPGHIYSHVYPVAAPSVLFKRRTIVPSSLGGLDATDANNLAFGATTFTIASTAPLYGWNFGYSGPAASAFTLPSNISIYQYVYEGLGPYGQYQALSANEWDCTSATGGTKGRNHMLFRDDNYIYTYTNPCTGGFITWGMCLFVTDAVAIPVNIPGALNPHNPFAYAGYTFDVGEGCVTPLSSSNQLQFQMTYEDYQNPGTSRFMLMGSPWVNYVPLGVKANCIPFGPVGNRLAHTVDALTDTAFTLLPFTVSGASGLYPACMWGTTIGALGGIPLPLPNYFGGLEIKFTGISTTGRTPSASFHVTYF
ncbi:MAG: hypothetical protein KJ645_04765, partial [Planctomycetes bacterium]|nr:hypothetical protein [Planctomycetota bacterium]